MKIKPCYQLGNLIYRDIDEYRERLWRAKFRASRIKEQQQYLIQQINQREK